MALSNNPLIGDFNSSALQKEETYLILSDSKKIELQKRTTWPIIRGIVSALLATLVLFFSAITIILGVSLLVGDAGISCIWTEIILPFLLPSMISFVFLAVPLGIYAWNQHKGILRIQKRIAESDYQTIYNYCSLPTNDTSKNSIAKYIQDNFFSLGLSKRYYHFSLTRLLKVFPKDRQDIHNVMEAGILRAKENLSMTVRAIEKRDKEEADKEKVKNKKS